MREEFRTVILGKTSLSQTTMHHCYCHRLTYGKPRYISQQTQQYEVNAWIESRYVKYLRYTVELGVCNPGYTWN